MIEQPMTRTERLELVKIVSQRAKLARQDIEARQAARHAEAEAKLSREFDREDEAWREFVMEAQVVVADTNAKIQEICERRGVPRKFRPKLGTYWLVRGENADQRRRAELRMALRAAAEAEARAKKLEVDRVAVEFKERLMSGALESAEARDFLAGLPTALELLPGSLDLPQIEGGGS